MTKGIEIIVPEGKDAIRQTIDDYRQRMLGVEASTLRRPWITRERLRDQTRMQLDTWPAVSGRAEDVLAGPVLAKIAISIAELPALAGLFWACDYAAQVLSTSEKKKELDELVPDVLSADVRLTRWLSPAVEEFGTSDERAQAARIRPGTGYQDAADDVTGWVSLALANPAILGAIPIAKSELLSMQTKALRLSGLLGESEATMGSPANLRKRAFTLWAEAYERIERNGRHVARELDLPVAFEGIHASQRAAATTVVTDRPSAPADPLAEPVLTN